MKGKQFQHPEIAAHSSRTSFWTYHSQSDRVSQTAGLREWSNMYRLRGEGGGGGGGGVS